MIPSKNFNLTRNKKRYVNKKTQNRTISYASRTALKQVKLYKKYKNPSFPYR